MPAEFLTACPPENLPRPEPVDLANEQTTLTGLEPDVEQVHDGRDEPEEAVLTVFPVAPLSVNADLRQALLRVLQNEGTPGTRHNTKKTRCPPRTRTEVTTVIARGKRHIHMCTTQAQKLKRLQPELSREAGTNMTRPYADK